jgi:alkanesulfonate monooxygenase SsuD/methylene tetrahydromethanopterin reductase-like flavin-dependent oxidoreductase (luciferase family)
MTTRGFGVAGALNRDLVAALACEAEAAGYATFWANDTESGDGLDAIRVAASTTKTIRFGVGVIPVDRVPAAQIAERVKRYGLPEDRLTIGIGSGGLKAGVLAAVRLAAEELKQLTTARIVIGALGPKMVTMAVQSSDGAVLNWLTPEYAAETAANCRLLNPETWLAAYVRVGLTGKGADRVIEEGARYARYPAYGAHFDRMGVKPEATSAYGDPDSILAKLAEFDASGVDETVVRAIAAEETRADYLAVLNAAAPRG